MRRVSWLLCLLLGGVCTASPSRVQNLTLYSRALGQNMALRVYLPPDYRPEVRYPVVYLMHPYGGDETFWLGVLPTQATLDELLRAGRIRPLLLVSPDLRVSFGVNSDPDHAIPGVTGGRFEDYLLRELVPYIDGHYATVRSRAGRSVGGISMGGYTALFLGLGHPELFSRVGAHSAALWDGQGDLYTGQRDWLYPSPALRNLRDPFRLLRRARLNSSRLFVDVGQSDALRPVNEHLVRELRQRGAQVTFSQSAGGHDLTYWATHLKDYLLFYGK